ncbi:dienelactone hydrolase family protein [Spiribacter halobius]|uniref:Dienelactone hydrolase n=1 Tax=Sediminicurvatus halobius TaxID=2182432 RepID=A0A2U2N716_9GAMM|nr:dienelactone hydrolase family protein [Spiribacter halobius]PWG64873.1 dienelactone hydrolase [Spiribacter halobius]UEX78272.1 dienelactone hydrolase family protein [Spiribacter halobius]
MNKNTVFASLCAAGLAMPLAASAEIVSGNVVYEVDGERFEGYHARNTALGDDQPTVFIVHDWDGLTDYEKRRAEMLAEQGYAAFAVDMFGEGVRPESVDHRRALTGALYEDRERMRELVQAGLDAMAEQSGFDPDRVVAMGYCFGGTVTLEMARAGMDVDGFVTFHGGLGTPEGQDYGDVPAPILVLHGTRDQAVTMEDVTDLVGRLDAEGVDFRMELYGGARHAFTVFGGDRYQPTADLRSWEALQDFLADRIGTGRAL